MKLGTKRLLIYAIFGVIAVILLAIALNGCAKRPVERESFAMDTIFSQTVYGDKEVLTQNDETIAGIENLMSKTILESDVSRINHAGGLDTDVDQMTADVLTAGLEAAQKTGGAFNPALGALTYQWGFDTDLQMPPRQSSIDRAIANSDYTTVTVEGTTVNAGSTQIDLGGIVKGYVLDKVKENLDANNVESALVSAGGSIYARGAKPDGTPWTVGVRNPLGDAADYICTIDLQDECVSTSGTYERGYTYNNTYYHHILDPHTGNPVENGLWSVSVISANGMETDIYSTALFVMGVDAGKAFAEENGLAAIFITEGKQIILTEEFGRNFELTDTSYAVTE